MLIEKTDGCKNNPENASTAKLGEHIPQGFSISLLKDIENKYNIYRGKDCNGENSINKQKKSYQSNKIRMFVKKYLKVNMLKMKVIVKLGNIVIVQGNKEVIHIAYITWNIVYLNKFL